MDTKVAADQLLIEKVRDHYLEVANQAEIVNGRGMLVEGPVNYWPPSRNRDHIGRFDNKPVNPIHPHTKELLTIEAARNGAKEDYDSVIIDYIDCEQLPQAARSNGFPRTMDDPKHYSDEVLIIVLSGRAIYTFKEIKTGKNKYTKDIAIGSVLFIAGEERYSLDRSILSRNKVPNTIILSARKIKSESDH